MNGFIFVFFPLFSIVLLPMSALLPKSMSLFIGLIMLALMTFGYTIVLDSDTNAPMGMTQASKYGFWVSFVIVSTILVPIRVHKHSKPSSSKNATGRKFKTGHVLSVLLMIVVLPCYPIIYPMFARADATILFIVLSLSAAVFTAITWFVPWSLLPSWARFLQLLSGGFSAAIILLIFIALGTGFIATGEIARHIKMLDYCFEGGEQKLVYPWQMTVLTMRNDKPFFFRKHPTDYHAQLVVRSSDGKEYSYYWSYRKMGLIDANINYSFSGCTLPDIK